MSRILTHIVAQLAFLGAMIGLIAFVGWGFDPASWGGGVRAFAAAAWIGLACLVAGLV